MTLRSVVTRERGGGLDFALPLGLSAGTRIGFVVQVARDGIIAETHPARGPIYLDVPSPPAYWNA